MINRYIKLIILLNIFLLSFQLNLMNSSSSYSANTPLSMIDSSIIGESTFLSSGYLISDAGDVNGDGYDDFIICAYKSDYTWKVYLIFGKSNGWIMDLDIINTAGASFLGSYSGEYFQVTSISDVGDINGDGYDEVMIGTQYTNFGGIYS